MELNENECAKCRKKIRVQKNYDKENMLYSKGNMDWSTIVKLIEWREDFL